MWRVLCAASYFRSNQSKNKIKNGANFKNKNINTAQRVHVEFPVGFRCQFDISECTSVASSCLTSDEEKKNVSISKKKKNENENVTVSVAQRQFRADFGVR